MAVICAPRKVHTAYNENLGKTDWMVQLYIINGIQDVLPISIFLILSTKLPCP